MDTLVNAWSHVLFYGKVIVLIVWTIVSMYLGALIGARNPQKLLKSKAALNVAADKALAAAKEKL
jgi:hypothetical protein